MSAGIFLAMGDKLTGGLISRVAIASYGGATLFGLHEIASGDVEEGVKDLASTAISAAGGMASSGVTVNINSTPNTGINLSSSGAATFTPSLIPSYSLSFSTSGSAIAIDQSMIFAETTTGGNGGYVGTKDNGEETKITSNLGNEIDITPSKKHTTTTKNPGLKGEPNSSVDIVDSNGNIKTRRWFDSKGMQIRDVDFTNHGNAKMHPEWPHEHGVR